MNESEYNKSKKKLSKVFLGITFITLLVWLFSSQIKCYLFPNLQDSSFEIIATLFSALSFAGVLFAIFLQRLELEMQREEIKNSTEQLEGQRRALDLQNFENKFFQMLSLHHSIVNSIKVEKSTHNEYHEKRSFFQFAAELVYNAYEGRNGESSNTYTDKEYPIKRLIEVFHNVVYKIYVNDLGHYFRNLYHIVKFVHETSELNEVEKERREIRKEYIKILRAQLSTYELALLGYNGMSWRGRAFVENINRYELLKNIDFSRNIASPEALCLTYPHLKNQYELHKSSDNENYKTM